MTRHSKGNERDLNYISPETELFQFVSETCIMTMSASGNAEGYGLNEFTDDLWM